MLSAGGTIGAALTGGGGRLRVFDLGRRVVTVPAEAFSAFEDARVPYPYPLRRSAWMGLLFWHPEEPEERIWFLRLPLDERAGLVQAARDDFLERLLLEAGARQAGGEAPDSGLTEDYSFRPSEQRMAVFHAKAARVLERPPSRFYAHARAYLAGDTGFDQWAFVGLQGLADVAAGLDHDDNEALVAAALPRLPPEPFRALSECLENEAPGVGVAQALAGRARAALGDGDDVTVAAALRACSRICAAGTPLALVGDVLSSPLASRIEVLVALAGRAWEVLASPEVRGPFLEALARNEAGQEAFNATLADLLFIPGMRGPLMEGLRAPERSPRLAEAMDGLFRAYTS